MDMLLDEIEVRVLGSLMEKELATPEYYPLSLNGLLNACNQKTSRLPVMSLDENAVVGALQSLKDKRLVYQSDASRVPRYSHTFTREHNLIRREAALLCTLLLRGPQTAGELRSRTERLCTFESLDEAGEALDNLSAIGLIVRLSLQPGRKEPRYAHLLSGEPEHLDRTVAGRDPAVVTPDADHDRLAELENSLASLREELFLLKREFAVFRKEFQ